jgi:hypothetical protein
MVWLSCQSINGPYKITIENLIRSMTGRWIVIPLCRFYRPIWAKIVDRDLGSVWQSTKTRDTAWRGWFQDKQIGQMACCQHQGKMLTHPLSNTPPHLLLMLDWYITACNSWTNSELTCCTLIAFISKLRSLPGWMCASYRTKRSRAIQCIIQ